MNHKPKIFHCSYSQAAGAFNKAYVRQKATSVWVSSRDFPLLLTLIYSVSHFCWVRIQASFNE